MSPFDEILEAIEDETDREAVQSLVQRNDRVRQTIERLEKDLEVARQWEKWAEENYIYDAYGPGRGATRRELEKDRKIAELQAQLEAYKNNRNGVDMTFEELNQYIDSLGVAKKSDLQEFEQKTQTLEERLIKTVGATLDPIALMPVWAMKYYDEFKTPMTEEQARAMLETAFRNNVPLEKAYDELVRPKREEIRAKELEEREKKAREEGFQEGLKQARMSEGSMPIEPEGGFDSFVKQLSSAVGGDQPNGDQAAIPSNVELGTGVLARHVAKVAQQAGGGAFGS